MNVFMPYANVKDSVKALDNHRLTKQVLECHQIMNAILKLHYEQTSDTPTRVGYAHHPVVQYYRKNVPFLICYAKEACYEYYQRFGRHHKCEPDFVCYFNNLPQILRVFEPATIFYHAEKYRCYTPDRSMWLFKNKLCEKWLADLRKGIEPRWIEIPEFFVKYIILNHDELLYQAQTSQATRSLKYDDFINRIWEKYHNADSTNK